MSPDYDLDPVRNYALEYAQTRAAELIESDQDLGLSLVEEETQS